MGNRGSTRQRRKMINHNKKEVGGAATADPIDADFDMVSEFSDSDTDGSSSGDEQAENAAFIDGSLLAAPGACKITLHPRHILQRATLHGKDAAVRKLVKEVRRVAQEDGVVAAVDRIRADAEADQFRRNHG